MEGALGLPSAFDRRMQVEPQQRHAIERIPGLKRLVRIAYPVSRRSG